MESHLSNALCTSLFTLGMIVSVQPASASIVSDFETLDAGPTDGWYGLVTASSFTAYDILDPSNHHFNYSQYVGSSGPYAIVKNRTKFIGDLSGYDGGIFSFDARFGTSVYNPNDNEFVEVGIAHTDFGEITLGTAVGTFVLPGSGDFGSTWGGDFDGDRKLEWHPYAVEMSANAWGVDQATWLLGLQSVDYVQINLGFDSLSTSFPWANLDNVRLDPVPIPPALWLFGSGLIGLIGVARRKKS